MNTEMEPSGEQDALPVVTDSRCECANTQGDHNIACPYWPLSLNGAPSTSPASTEGGEGR